MTASSKQGTLDFQNLFDVLFLYLRHIYGNVKDQYSGPTTISAAANASPGFDRRFSPTIDCTHAATLTSAVN